MSETKNDIISHAINTRMKVLLCFSGVYKTKSLLLNIFSVGKYFIGGLDSMSFGYAAKYKPGSGNEIFFEIKGFLRPEESFS